MMLIMMHCGSVLLVCLSFWRFKILLEALMRSCAVKQVTTPRM